MRASSPVAACAGAIVRPELHLSGARLRAALNDVLVACEAQGGVENYIDALKIKARMFSTALLEGNVAELDIDTLAGLCTFMPTVRRRVAPYLTGDSLDLVRSAIGDLLREYRSTATTDLRLHSFVARFPGTAEHRWVRDFAAELLHQVSPELYPLMTRWVWDTAANTGVLREIWFGTDVDSRSIPVADSYGTFLVLREEMSVFLTENGFYRDLPFYVDLMQARIYAEYVAAQGGSYLRTDFSMPEDPLQHTRRMLGLDGVKAGTSKTRLKAVDGTSFVLHVEVD